MRSIAELRQSCRAMHARYGTRLQKQQPAAADASTPAYDELRVRGEAKWRAGLAGSPWEGIGQAADDDPALYDAFEQEVREGKHHPKTGVTKETTMPNTSGNAEQQIMALAKAHQAENGGSLGDAIGHVATQHPDLWERHRHAPRHAPVAKVVPPKPPPKHWSVVELDKRVAVLKQQQPGLSHADAWGAVLNTAEGDALWQAHYQHNGHLLGHLPRP